ncbi:MAG: hypothetical protein R2861_04290 [Desulfobacterales bacterium]
MNPKLSEILKNISDEYQEKISTVPGTRNYLEVDIGERAGKLGFSELKDQYRRVNAVVPLKEEVFRACGSALTAARLWIMRSTIPALPCRDMWPRKQGCRDKPSAQ